MNPKENRKLVWSEEFDNINSIDETVFNYQTTMKNFELNLVRDNKNIEFSDSCMTLKDTKEPKNSQFFYSVPDGLTTENKLSYKYGYIEMRAKVPFGLGRWPSFWLCTTEKYSKTKINAEIDIFEVFSATDTIKCNLHKWLVKGEELLHTSLDGKRKEINRRFTFDEKDIPDNWHTYGFEWTDEVCKFYIDDNCFCSLAITDDSEFGDELPGDTIMGMECFREYHHIRLNNFLFTQNAPEWPPESYRLPTDFNEQIDYTIDYIRLYQNEKESFVLEK